MKLAAGGRPGPASLLISGASTGIGQALAELYAAPDIRLALIGRDADRLACVAEACRAKGAEVEVATLDVRDRDAVSERLRAIAAAHPIDLVIANAGIALPETSEAALYAVIDTNLVGALSTVAPLLPAMLARGHGQVAFISSLAGLSPLADAAAYSASKAALVAYGAALREKLSPAGIRVSVACPGFVATGMGRRYRGARPFEITAAAAAARIADGLARNRGLIAFPWPLAFSARAAGFLPERLRRLATSALRFSIDEQDVPGPGRDQA